MSELLISVDEEEGIEHYGVKGMRWGVRRTDAQLAKSKKKKGDDGEKKVVGKTSTKKAKASDLSDAALQKRINRLNMEKQYAKLTADPPSTTKKLTGFVGKSVMKATKKEADKYIQAKTREVIKVGQKTAKKKAKNRVKLEDLGLDPKAAIKTVKKVSSTGRTAGGKKPPPGYL